MLTSVHGIYSSQHAAELAIAKLKEAGFPNTDISLLFPGDAYSKEFASEHETMAPEAAVAGAGVGALAGGAFGWLAGIGALMIPGVGPFIAAGPIVTALAGFSVGGVAGGLAGSLVGLGIPEHEAKRYVGHIESGKILLSVHSDDADWDAKARQILADTDAEDISSVSAALELSH